MSTLETIVVVFAVYGVVFLAHRATPSSDPAEGLPEDEEPRREVQAH